MVDYDDIGPILQLIRARFLNFILSKLPHDFQLCEVLILLDFQGWFWSHKFSVTVR